MSAREWGRDESTLNYGPAGIEGWSAGITAHCHGIRPEGKLKQQMKLKYLLNGGGTGIQWDL